MMDSYQYIQSAERLDDFDDWIYRDDLPSEREFENQVEMTLIFLGVHEWNLGNGVFMSSRGKIPLRIEEPEVALTNHEYHERHKRGVYEASDIARENMCKAQAKRMLKSQLQQVTTPTNGFVGFLALQPETVAPVSIY